MATKPKPAKKSAAKSTPKPRPKSSKPSPSGQVDRQLARYRAMRDFQVTAEPSGGDKPSRNKADALPFVIQKHAATRLHYDFRLGWNGVLKSWAVAKGPSYFPGDKRLAVQVEDHPIEYGGFEGVIPKGQYGGGTVMVWDQGAWSPQPGHTDIDAGLRDGALKFVLHGEKMKGKWALVRMGGKAANAAKPNWLLVKEHDEFERGADDTPITDESPKSAVTGRSLEEIASQQDHVWNSQKTAKRQSAQKEQKDAKNDLEHPRSVLKSATKWPSAWQSSPEEKLPGFIHPQLASQAANPPKGNGWLHELKLDGYRIQARKDGKNVQLLTRTGLDWTRRMKPIAAAVAGLPANTLLADGEVVVLAEDGTTSFANLQAAFQDGAKHPLTCFLFDLLHLDGRNLRGLPLADRKSLLAQLLENTPIRLSEHLVTSGESMFYKACELRAEGIVSKRADSKYTSGRSASWLKLKCVHSQEFVIGGFTLPSNGTRGVGALLLGYYESSKLKYAGRTGTGFSQQTHKLLRNQLDTLRQASTPFDNPPAEARREAIWVKPKLVAQVNFSTWTAGHLVRQASFQGLREDKPAEEVARETANSAPKPRSARHAAPSSIAAKAAPVETFSESKAKEAVPRAPIRLTHPEKILDAESQLTKQQLADYYWEIAPHMLPHIASRPLSLVRCPEGSGQPCFFQKHPNAMLPKDVGSVEIADKKTGKPEPYITLSSRTALAQLAQMGVLEVHPWGSRNDDLERPDRIVIDLDPDPAIDWRTLAESAAEVRRQLKKHNLESFLKTTGGKGLHIVVPIDPDHEWPAIKQFAHEFALALEKRNPQLYLTRMGKAARAGRIYIDYLRNERGATAVAAYSPRARPGAPVSLPLAWSDLKLPQRPAFRVVNYPQWKPRLSRDPWKNLPALRQRITPEMLRAYS